MPSLTRESLWQMPQASTFTRTWLGPGSGMLRSTSSQSPPALLICAAFIFVLISAPDYYLSCFEVCRSCVREQLSMFTKSSGLGIHSTIHGEIRPRNVRGLRTGDERYHCGDRLNMPVA